MCYLEVFSPNFAQSRLTGDHHDDLDDVGTGGALGDHLAVLDAPVKDNLHQLLHHHLTELRVAHLEYEEKVLRHLRRPSKEQVQDVLFGQLEHQRFGEALQVVLEGRGQLAEANVLFNFRLKVYFDA